MKISMPEIELLTVANHAEAINGLLYLMGAGWTDLVRARGGDHRTAVNHFGIGIAIKVAWDETNRRHHVTVTIENEAGIEQMKVEADFELGRPAGLPPGTDLRSVLAINADVAFASTGTYRLVATVGEHSRAVVFRIRDDQLGSTTATPRTGH